MCVFTFWFTCCNVSYDFRIKIMFGSSLSPVVCSRVHVLFMLFVFACALWCPTHIMLCVLLCFSSSSVHTWLFLRFSLTFIYFVLYLVCPMLPVSLDCLFLIAPSIFSHVYLKNNYGWRQYIPLLIENQVLFSL
jgi:hypothetical protein